MLVKEKAAFLQFHLRQSECSIGAAAAANTNLHGTAAIQALTAETTLANGSKIQLRTEAEVQRIIDDHRKILELMAKKMNQTVRCIYCSV